MSKSSLRIAVIALTLVTSIVHLYLGVSSLGDNSMRTLTILWLLNGVGWLVLLGGVLGITPILKNYNTLSHYALIAFAAATIIAWFVMGDRTEIFGIVTKVIEILLIIATYMHLRK
jgi:hypothetical protein